MSAYGREVEREFSAQSLLTRGGSEMGSRYTTEAGIYMSSFAATVFISGLVIVGISVLSLLVALAVMLNSCESRNSGVLEMYRNTHSYDYCRNFALHAELNSLGADLYPAICKDINIWYVKEGQYRRDLNITVGIAEDFFSSVRPQNDGRDVVLMDADDFLASEILYADQLKYWKPEKLRNTTVEYLISVGCHGWSSLIMRMDNEMKMDYQEFLSRQRIMLQREGFRIKAVISSQMDALRAPCLGDRIFKLPNPIFRYGMEDHDEYQIRKE